MISILALYSVSTAQLAYSGFGASHHVSQSTGMIQSSAFRLSRSSPHCVHRAGFLLSGFTVTTRPNFGVQHRRMYRVRATLDGSESNDDPKEALTDAHTESEALHDLDSKIDSLSRDLSSKTDTNFVSVFETLISKIDSLSIDFKANLKSEIASSNANLKSEIGSILKSEIASRDADLKSEIAGLKTEITDLKVKVVDMHSTLTAARTVWNFVQGILAVGFTGLLAGFFKATIPWTTFPWWPWKQ